MLFPTPGTSTSLPQPNTTLRLTHPSLLLLPFPSLGDAGVRRRADSQSAASRQNLLFLCVLPKDYSIRGSEKTSVEELQT